MSELLRSVMVECAELARDGRNPTPFYGCAQVMGGGGALGIVQPPIALASELLLDVVPTFKGPVIVYNRDTDAAPTTDRRRGDRRAQRHVQPIRRVA